MIFDTDYRHTKAKSLILCNLGCGFKDLVFFRNGKHEKGSHCNKMGTDNLAKDTPNATEFICPICLPKPKSSGLH